MPSALTRLALSSLAVLVVLVLFVAIGIGLAAYKSWVRKKRGPEEFETALAGDSCSSCAVPGREEHPTGVVKGPDLEKPTRSDLDS
jgi:hypothetical protein